MNVKVMYVAARPAKLIGSEYILVSYYHSNRTENFFHSMKTVKIMKEELKEAAL